MSSLDLGDLFRPRRRIQVRGLPAGAPRPAADPIRLFFPLNRRRPQLVTITDFSGLSQAARAVADIVRVNEQEQSIEETLRAQNKILPFLERQRASQEAQAFMEGVLGGERPPPPPGGLIMGSEGEQQGRPEELEKTRQEIADRTRDGSIPAARAPILREQHAVAVARNVAVDTKKRIFETLPQVSAFTDDRERLGQPLADAHGVLKETLEDILEQRPYLDPRSEHYDFVAGQTFADSFAAIAHEYLAKADQLYNQNATDAYLSRFQKRVIDDVDLTLQQLSAPELSPSDRDKLTGEFSDNLTEVFKEMVKGSGLPLPFVPTTLGFMEGSLRSIEQQQGIDEIERSERLHEALDLFREMKLGSVKAQTNSDFLALEGRWRARADGGSRAFGGRGRVGDQYGGIDRRLFEFLFDDVFEPLNEIRETKDRDDQERMIGELRDQLDDLLKPENEAELMRVLAQGRRNPPSVMELEANRNSVRGYFDKVAATILSGDPETTSQAHRTIVTTLITDGPDMALQKLQDSMLGGTIGIDAFRALRRDIEASREMGNLVGEGTEAMIEIKALNNEVISDLAATALPPELKEPVERAVREATAEASRMMLAEARRLRDDQELTDPQREAAMGEFMRNQIRPFLDAKTQPLADLREQQRVAMEALEKAAQRRQRLTSEQIDFITRVFPASKAAELRRNHIAATDFGSRVWQDEQLAGARGEAMFQLDAAVQSAVRNNSKIRDLVRETVTGTTNEREVQQQFQRLYRKLFTDRVRARLRALNASGSDDFAADTQTILNEVREELEESVKGDNGRLIEQLIGEGVNPVDAQGKIDARVFEKQVFGETSAEIRKARANASTDLFSTAVVSFVSRNYKDTLLGPSLQQAYARAEAEREIEGSTDRSRLEAAIDQQRFLLLSSGLEEGDQKQALYDIQALTSFVPWQQIQGGTINLIAGKHPFDLARNISSVPSPGLSRDAPGARGARAILIREHFVPRLGEGGAERILKGFTADAEGIDFRPATTLFHNSEADIERLLANEEQRDAFFELIGWAGGPQEYKSYQMTLLRMKGMLQ